MNYDKVLKSIENEIAKCDNLKTLLELYSRQSFILKMLLEQTKLDGENTLKQLVKVG